MTRGRAEWARIWGAPLTLGASALRPWRMLDISRLILALVYVFTSFAFSSARSWAEHAEHGIVLGLLAVAVGTLLLSARSWVIEIRIRKLVVCADALLFLALLIVTDPSHSPYFPGSLFIAIEIALIIPRYFHHILGVIVGLAAILLLRVDEVMAVTAEPDLEWNALRVLYLVVAVTITGMLLGPRRETLLERERGRRLAEAGAPPAGGLPGPYLLQALRIATGADHAAVLFRMTSHDRYMFASTMFGDDLPPGAGRLLAVGTEWHDCGRNASISLSADGFTRLLPLTPSGWAWGGLLEADTLMSVRASLGAFEAIGVAPLPDPVHEDSLAIAQRLFEGACEELVVRNSLDLAHVVAGARERDRLQRDLHDSVLQALASIRFQLAPLLSNRTIDPRPVIENVDRIAKDQIATIRYIINPDISDEDFAYLPETLAMVVRSLGDQWGIACELKVRDGNCATSAMIGRELSFAVREIVANAVRHAKARTVEFTLEPAGNRIALHVADDGVPNLARLGASGAVSSRSLMRRIQALGGEVFLHSMGGRTMIQITVPRK
ncbi:sensor histidine kinase [Sphingobium vermicomposti]|uniref:Signal transduction histidine kinase n=1 Tax=Sphingobium vermicomposti TaxID=529005 RepID=A0A846M708_9SPHN|nr:signal transduction histidine kinase [Sphingobium vermicomposti]